MLYSSYAKRDIVYTDQEVLIEILLEVYEEESRKFEQLMKAQKKDNQKLKLGTVLFNMGIKKDKTMCLCDERTMQLLQMYCFYKYTPQIIDNYVWFEAYQIINKLQPRLF